MAFVKWSCGCVGLLLPESQAPIVFDAFMAGCTEADRAVLRLFVSVPDERAGGGHHWLNPDRLRDDAQRRVLADLTRRALVVDDGAGPRLTKHGVLCLEAAEGADVRCPAICFRPCEHHYPDPEYAIGPRLTLLDKTHEPLTPEAVVMLLDALDWLVVDGHKLHQIRGLLA